MKRAPLLTALAATLFATLRCSTSGSVGTEPDGKDGGRAGPDDSTTPPFSDGSYEEEKDVECKPGCSADLHTAFPCDQGGPVDCPGDQGCDPTVGKCVPACDAAGANQQTAGCEFYAVPPAGYGQSFDIRRCFAAFIANTWNTPVKVAVDYGGTSLNVDDFTRIPSGTGTSVTYTPTSGGEIPPGEVGIVFLINGVPGSSPSTICPSITAGAYDGPMLDGTGIEGSFHITTDRPVAAYDIFPFDADHALASGTMLLPTSIWGDNYVAVDPFSPNTSTALGAPFVTHLIAKEDGTNVTVLPTADIAGAEDVEAAPQNVATTYTLSRGQQLKLATATGLSGSIIKSDKPIGMWSTTGLLFVDVDDLYGDSSHQQIPPVRALGSEYVGVRYRNRNPDPTVPDEAPPWRILGLVDGTKLAYDPEPPTGAPSTLDAGELATFNTGEPFVVRSQDDAHPIYVAAYMTGCTKAYPGGDDCRGDPEHLTVVPAKQFLTSYVFFSDPTYRETSIVVVRSKADDSTFKRVTLDCAGPLDEWQPVGHEGLYEYTRVDLTTKDFQPVNGCDNGRHEIFSDAPFGVTVWGWGITESYAYPGGASGREVNHVVIPPVPK